MNNSFLWHSSRVCLVSRVFQRIFLFISYRLRTIRVVKTCVLLRLTFTNRCQWNARITTAISLSPSVQSSYFYAENLLNFIDWNGKHRHHCHTHSANAWVKTFPIRNVPLFWVRLHEKNKWIWNRECSHLSVNTVCVCIHIYTLRIYTGAIFSVFMIINNDDDDGDDNELWITKKKKSAFHANNSKC